MSKFIERRIEGKVIQPTLQETMQQVALHCTYHRELGGEPVNVNFIARVWLGKLTADWSCLKRI